MDNLKKLIQQRKLAIEFGRSVAAADREAKRIPGYKGYQLSQMIVDYGGYEASRRVLHRLPLGRVQEGFTTLYMLRRLDLSIEWKALHPKWRPIFEKSLRSEAERRLAMVGCSWSRVLLPGKEPQMVLHYSLEGALD